MAASAEPTLEWWRSGAIGRSRRGEPRLLFGQVHEDAAVELAALASVPNAARVACIASGGDTAFALLGAGMDEVHALDINPAQIGLVSLKQDAIQRLDGPELLKALDGLSHAGWAEARLRVARRLFRTFVHRLPTIEAMLLLDDPDEQRRVYQATWRNAAWRTLFAAAFSRPVLGLLYRRGVLRSVPSDFGALMERRIERAFTGSPNRRNPYLWQALLGRYAPNGLPPYLEALDAVRANLPRLRLHTAEVAGWLESQPAGSFDFVALSNVTELTSATYGSRLAGAVKRAARPGALALVRSIFPPPADHPFAAHLQFEGLWSEQLQLCDRSLVCNFIRVFRA